MKEANAEQAWNSLKQELAQIATNPARPFVVVCVDDEQILLDLMAERVRELGLHVETFLRAKDALEYLKDKHNDVGIIISDVKMPEMDGFEFRLETIKICPSVPFAVLSAHVTREMALQGIEYKISAFLNKPADDLEFASVLKRELVTRLKSIVEDRELIMAFFEDAKSLLEQIESNALELEGQLENRDLFNGIFGFVHTLKGGCGFFDTGGLHGFIHKFEDLLKPIQSGDKQISSNVVTMILKAVDYLRSWLSDLELGRISKRDPEGQLKQLVALASEESAKDNSSSGPSRAPSDVDKKSENGQKPRELRVDISVLDQFLQASGEMTVIRNMLNKTVQSIEKRYQSDREVQMLSELLDELHKINASVQNKITEVRKVTMRTILKPVPRVVREVSKTLGKNVDLQFKGEDVRIDTSVAEVLNNCLLHLVKNSLDHGLETPKDRKASGKNERGRLEVSTRIADEMIYVEISDDGRGINTAAIKEKMLKNGWSQADVNKMSEEDLKMMIFASGLSTAAQTTDISGRGVGMSAVKESVESIGGKIKVKSTRGVGSTMTLELPVPKSVLIKNCLFVDCGKQSFGIPQDQIIRVYQSSEQSFREQVVHLEGSYTLRLADEVLPIVQMSDLLGLTKTEVLPSDFKAVIVQTASERRFALVINEVYEFEDAVVKTLVPSLKNLEYYGGATFLGDGKIGLIFDIDGIARKVGLNSKKATRQTDLEGAQNAISANWSSYVAFELDVDGVYTLPQGQVYRIEEFAIEDLQNSAGVSVIPYRGDVMPIIDVSSLLGEPSLDASGKEADPEKVQVVVVAKENRFWGLRVHRISDIIGGDAPVQPSIDRSGLVKGMQIINGQTVTLIDGEKVIATFRGHDVQGTVTELNAGNLSQQRAA